MLKQNNAILMRNDWPVGGIRRRRWWDEEWEEETRRGEVQGGYRLLMSTADPPSRQPRSSLPGAKAEALQDKQQRQRKEEGLED